MLTLFPLVCCAAIRYDAPAKSWVLASGGIEYRLAERRGTLAFDYFGPASQRNWPSHPAPTPRPPTDIDGEIDWNSLSSPSLVFRRFAISKSKQGADTLRLTLEHRMLPVEVDVLYSVWGDTGVFTRSVEVRNRGRESLLIQSLPSLAWNLPHGDYELVYLWGGWGQERQMTTETLAVGRRSFVARQGRSTAEYSPWFALRNKSSGVVYVAQLAWSGNWEMNFERTPAVGDFALNERAIFAELRPRFDAGPGLRLAPGASYRSPTAVFTADAGDLDDATNRMHRYQRRYVIPHTPTNSPLLVQFNSWNPFPGKMTVEEMKRYATQAGDLGAEVFILDAGWFAHKNWDTEMGDWRPDPTAFPHGLEELADFVRGRGMKFGLWVEIESLGKDSEMFRKHPEWCLSWRGVPVERSLRYHLNFERPDARQWARSVIDRLIARYGLSWLKIDYNVSIGDQFDTALSAHIDGLYRLLDEIRAAHPDLVIENCSSGALRSDLGMVSRTHTSWLSDFVKPLPSLQLGYGCTVEYTPEVCNHWMVGDDSEGHVDQNADPGWWDFLFRVPMNGQFGFSSRIAEWNPALRRRAAENIAIYKRIRHVIAGADVFHLTPQPKRNDPAGWMTIQYVTEDRLRSVLLVYRLAQSEPVATFHLRGLDPARSYRVSQDGRAGRPATGQGLLQTGLSIELSDKWRASVIELDAEGR